MSKVGPAPGLESPQAAAQRGEPGRLPKLKGWSQKSREALQTRATVERRELRRERQRILRVGKIFSLQLNTDHVPKLLKTNQRQKVLRAIEKHPKILDAKIPADHIGPANLCFR